MKEPSLQNEINRYTRLSEIILAVSSAKDLDTLLSESIKKIYTVFEFDSCWLALLNRDSISYSVQQIFSTENMIAKKEDCVLLNVGVCGWVIEYQQMYLSDDWKPSEDEVIKTNEPIKSILALPLQVGGQTIGTMIFTAKKSDSFQIVDLEMAVTFTVHMALAIDRWKQLEHLVEMNKDLEQRVQQRTQQLRITNRSLQQKISESEKAQTEFLQSIHPSLATIEKEIEILMQGNSESEILQRLQATAKDLLFLINKNITTD